MLPLRAGRVRGGNVRVLLVFLLALPLFAADYELFDNNGRRLDYSAIVAKLKPNDRVIFHDGSSFVLGEKLGEGNMDVIFRIETKRAIRLARFAPEENHLKLDTIAEFLQGYRRLKRAGVPIVNVDTAWSSKGEYAIVEIESVKKNFLDLANELAKNPDDSHLQQEFEELKTFFAKTALLTTIADLHPGNLVLTNTGWKMIDFMDGVAWYRGDSILALERFRGLAERIDTQPLYKQNDEMKHAFNVLPKSFQRELAEVVRKGRATGNPLWRRVTSSCAVLFREIFILREFTGPETGY